MAAVRIGVLVEAETEVVNDESEGDALKNIAMQIAALRPQVCKP